MSNFKNGKKKGVKGAPLKTKHPEKDIIRGTLVRLLWRAAVPGLKPLRLPRTHLPHLRVNQTKQRTLPPRRYVQCSMTMS